LAACVEGYNAAHGGEADPDPMSSDEFDDMVSRHLAIVKGGGEG
jgi:hypothetical protein